MPEIRKESKIRQARKDANKRPIENLDKRKRKESKQKVEQYRVKKVEQYRARAERMEWRPQTPEGQDKLSPLEASLLTMKPMETESNQERAGQPAPLQWVSRMSGEVLSGRDIPGEDTTKSSSVLSALGLEVEGQAKRSLLPSQQQGTSKKDLLGVDTIPSVKRRRSM